MAIVSMLQEKLKEDGFTIVDGVLSQGKIAELIKAVTDLNDSSAIRKRGGIFAIRNLIDECPQVRNLAASGEMKALVEPVLGTYFFPVRGIFFDKIPDANWKVPGIKISR